MVEYEPVIGFEIHAELATRSKVFCGCGTSPGAPPNTHTCPICLGMPGVLPVLNQQALEYALQVALACHCEISSPSIFERKNYYYPDLPKNFQISQFDKPIAFDGRVTIPANGAGKRIRIRRVHLEEDAGKLIHDTPGPYSFVDYNRAGIPLLEIVTEPDIASPDEAHEYLSRLKSILEYLDVSNCDMEKGSLRCDANISVRSAGTTALGVKVELKNMNSFKGVKNGLEFEAARQIGLAGSGEAIVQETRLWDQNKGVTMSMRTKEEAHDYRYFPEPDLVPFVESAALVEEAKRSIPELPEARAKRFTEAFGLSAYDAAVLVSAKATADYYEVCLAQYDKPKIAANWISGDLTAAANEKASPYRTSA